MEGLFCAQNSVLMIWFKETANHESLFGDSVMNRNQDRIYVLHENDAWVEPLRAAFDELQLPYEEWFLDEGIIRFDKEPPHGVFYNRMSASSHTRGHRYGPELAHATLNWLEHHSRRVVNGSRALYLEVSKIAQYAALEQEGITTPKTVAVVGRENVYRAAQEFREGPYIIKPNRGGKGLGVVLCRTLAEVECYFAGADVVDPIDGIWLVQEYLQATEPYITRCEFVGGKFLYAVRVDASGGFELCPADECSIEDAFCPVDSSVSNKFTIVDDMISNPLIQRYERFLANSGIGVAGIELIHDSTGRFVTYDVNTNTNYNAQAEAEAGVTLTGMRAIAQFLGKELKEGRDRENTLFYNSMMSWGRGIQVGRV